MKIGIFADFVPAEFGGGHTYQTEIISALDDHMLSCDQQFCLFGATNTLPETIRDLRNMEYFPLGTNRGSDHRSRLQRGLGRLQRGFHRAGKGQEEEKRVLDLIKGHGVEIMWGLGPFAAALDVPYIVTVWDVQHRLQPFFPEVSTGGEWLRRETHYGELLRRAWLVFTGTERGRCELETFYEVLPERIRVLPFFTPSFALRASYTDPAEVLKKYGLSRGFLFYPAQFWPHKNHACLIHALRLLHADHGLSLDAVFVGANRGNLEHLQKMLADLGLEDHVHILGYVPQADLVGLYRSAFALAFASFFGPDNLPPLEAFAFGCPVIAANVPGAQEQLGDAALFFDPRSEWDLARAVKLLHERPGLRDQLVTRGYERASRWTTKDYLFKVFEIFDALTPVRRCWGR